MRKVRVKSLLPSEIRQRMSEHLQHAFPAFALASCSIAVLASTVPGAVQAVPVTGMEAIAGRTPGSQGAGLTHVAQIGSDFMAMDVVGKEDEPLLLKIALPPNPTTTYSFLMFQGLPPKFTLSAGFATKSQWAVSLHDLGGLKLVPPAGYTGAFSLDVLLMKGKDVEPERRTIRVEFLPAAGSPVTTAAMPSQVLTANRQELESDASKQSAAKRPLVAQPIDDEDKLMVERGDLLFRQGDVAAARLIYHRLAKKGFPVAALAMARTYDPDVLKTLKVEGLQPDIAQARVWYKLADELGSPQARSRLSTLREGN